MKAGAALTIAAVLVLAALSFSVGAAGGDPQQTYRGRTAQAWYHQAALRHRQLRVLERRAAVRVRSLLGERRDLRRAVRSLRSPTPRYAIKLAAATFSVPESEMLAVALCETGGDLNPYSHNPSSSAAGLFQFLDSTWRRAGLAGFSVYDPVANALAAARLVRADGGWSEWTCRP